MQILIAWHHRDANIKRKSFDSFLLISCTLNNLKIAVQLSFPLGKSKELHLCHIFMTFWIIWIMMKKKEWYYKFNEKVIHTLFRIDLIAYVTIKNIIYITKSIWKKVLEKGFHMMYFCFLIDHFSPLRYSAYYEWWGSAFTPIISYQGI